MPTGPASDTEGRPSEPAAADADPPQRVTRQPEPQFAAAIVTPWTPPVALPPSAWKRARAISALTGKHRH